MDSKPCAVIPKPSLLKIRVPPGDFSSKSSHSILHFYGLKLPLPKTSSGSGVVLAYSYSITFVTHTEIQVVWIAALHIIVRTTEWDVCLQLPI